MSYIKLKGIQSPVEVEQEKALRLKTLWEQYKRSEIQDDTVSVGTITCSLSDIKVIDTKGERTNKDWSEYIERSNLDFKDYKKKKMMEDPIERSKGSYKLAQLVWWAHTGEWDPPKKEEAGIKHKILAFHQENTDKIYANPTLYKDLIPKSTDKEPAPFRQGAMRLVESILQQV